MPHLTNRGITSGILYSRCFKRSLLYRLLLLHLTTLRVADHRREISPLLLGDVLMVPPLLLYEARSHPSIVAIIDMMVVPRATLLYPVDPVHVTEKRLLIAHLYAAVGAEESLSVLSEQPCVVGGRRSGGCVL